MVRRILAASGCRLGACGGEDMVKKGQSSLKSPAATTRRLRGQSSLEFMLLLVAVAVVSLLALSTVNSQMSVQKEAHKNATFLLEKSSLALAGNLSAATSNPYTPLGGGANSSGITDMRLELATSQPYYANQTSVVQLVTWNYGGSTMSIPKLQLQSNSSDLLLSPNESSSVTVGLSYTMNSLISPKKPGTYLLSGKALDAAGKLMRNSDGQPIRVNATIVVLAFPTYPGPNPTPTPTPTPAPIIYSIAYSRSNEKIGYSFTPQGKIKGAYITVIGRSYGMEGNSWCACPAGTRAVWGFSEYNQWGTQNLCGCLIYYDAADSAIISTTPKYFFNNLATVTNATNTSAGCGLTHDVASCALPKSSGTVRLSGSVSATGSSPASDSVLTSEIGKNDWRLRSLPTYNAYQGAFASLDSHAAGINGNMWCSRNCGGIQNLVDSVESQKNSLLAGSSGSAASCSAAAGYVKCAPSSFTYPAIVFNLNSTFLGGHIPPSKPDVRTISGITTEVSTD